MQTREKIQVAATTLFSTVGYENCSVDRIAAAADVSKGAVYYCYKSKEEILYSIVEDGILAFEKKVCASIERDVDETVIFDDTITTFVDLFFGNRDLCIIVMRDLLCTKNNVPQEKITALTDRLFSFTSIMLQKGQAGGMVKNIDSSMLARTVCAVLYGFLLFPGSGNKNEATLAIKNIIKSDRDEKNN